MAFVRVGVGPTRGAKKRQTQDIPFSVISVLAVVQNAEAMLRVGKVSPVQRRNLELGLFVRSVACGRPLDGAEWNFVCRFFGMYARGKSYLQQNMLFVPINLHIDIDT